MKKTIQDRLAEALVAMGEREVESKTRKYRTFTRKAGGFYFLGRSGALRFGTCSSKSLSVTDIGKQRLLNREARPECNAGGSNPPVHDNLVEYGTPGEIWSALTEAQQANARTDAAQDERGIVERDFNGAPPLC